MCPIACSHYLHQRSCQWKIDLKRLVFPSCETHMLWISSVACILDKKFLYALSHTCSPKPLVGSALSHDCQMWWSCPCGTADTPSWVPRESGAASMWIRPGISELQRARSVWGFKMQPFRL